MKLKRSLLIILLAVIATMLLQVNVKADVNAEEIDYSGYFYLLTDEGVVTQLLPGVELIAGIKGEYTGEITADVANKKITINNFTAEELRIFDTEYNLWIEGDNSLKTVRYDNNGWGIYVYGNGKITTGSYVASDFYGNGEWSYSEETEESTCTYYIGDSIDNTVEQITINLSIYDLDNSGKILDNVAEKICKLLELDGDISYFMSVSGNPVIPASIFATLKETGKSLEICDDKMYIVYSFDGRDITNTNSDFKIGVVISNLPYEGMIDAVVEDARYVGFSNSESYPGKVRVCFVWGGLGTDGEVAPIPLYIYSFDEESKLYKYKGTEQDPFEVYNFTTDAPIGRYVLTHTILPDELVIGENAKEETTGGNQEGTGGEITGEEENKGTEQTPSDEKKEEVKQEDSKKEETKAEATKAEATKTEDTTTATGKIPYAGGTTAIVVAIIAIIAIGVIAYMKNRELRGI